MSHAFYRTTQGGERRIPRSGDTQGGRMSHAFYRTAQWGERRIPRSGDALGRSAKLMLRQR